MAKNTIYEIYYFTRSIYSILNFFASIILSIIFNFFGFNEISSTVCFNAFHNNGVIYTKVGQFIATINILDDVYNNKLNNLYSDGQKEDVDWSYLNHIPVKHIIKKPIGIGSVAQTFKAILNNNDIVCIKISKRYVKYDIYTLSYIIYFLNSILCYINFKNIKYFRIIHDMMQIQNCIDNIIIEYDLSIENKNIISFNNINNLRKNKLYIPNVYSEYTRKNVIVMEYIEGITLNKYRYKDENDIKKKTNIIRDNILSFLTEYSLFHGDIHKGNIIISKDKLYLIDYGLCYSNIDNSIFNIFLLLMSLLHNDYQCYLRILFDIISNTKNEDIKKQFCSLFSKYEYIYKENDIFECYKTKTKINTYSKIDKEIKFFLYKHDILNYNHMIILNSMLLSMMKFIHLVNSDKFY